MGWLLSVLKALTQKPHRVAPRGWAALPVGLLGLLVGLLAGCRQPSPPRASPLANPSDARPLVLTTFTVLADMARNVAGERFQVRSITRRTSE